MRPTPLARGQGQRQPQAIWPSLTLCISLVIRHRGGKISPTSQNTKLRPKQNRPVGGRTGTGINIPPSHHLASILWLPEGQGWPCSNAAEVGRSLALAEGPSGGDGCSSLSPSPSLPSRRHPPPHTHRLPSRCPSMSCQDVLWTVIISCSCASTLSVSLL